MRQDVLHAIAVMAESQDGSEQTIVERLVETGYDVLRAELLTAFVPLGLGRALIAELRFNPPIRLSTNAIVRDSTVDRMLQVELDQIPEFRIAKQLGEETFLTGVIPRDEFSAASSIGVEVKLINQALDAGKEVAGGTMATPILLRLAEAPGFEDWYEGLRSNGHRSLS